MSYEQATYTVAEGSSITVKVKLDVAPERTVTVPINKVPQGGATTADYSGVPTSVTFNGGATEVNIPFAAASDSVDDDGESVKLTFGSLPTGVTEGTTNETVVSIIDDDVPAVTVSYEQGAYTVAEGSSITVKVKLDVAPERTVTVPINKVPQGGATTADYSGVPTSVTFNSGDTEVDIPFAAASDSVNDDGESVKLTFGSLPTGVTEGTTNETVVSIIDDDVPAVTVSYEQGAYTVAEGSSTSVKVKLSADPERTVTVPINKVPQGGATTADYSGVPTSVTFNGGATEVNIPFAAASDSVDDDGESVKLTFGNLPTGVTEGTTNETVVSITDDDVPAVTVSYEQATYTVAEGSSITVKVKLDVAPERTVTVPINKVPQGGATTADYSGVPTSVTFNGGATEVNIPFAAASDSVDDDGESVKLTFGTLPTGVTEGTTKETVVSITDDDVPAVTVSYEQGAYTVAESDDSSTTEVEEHKVTIKVKLSADPERTVTVPINKAPQGGATSADYSGVPEDITFEAGDTEKTFTFTATADTVDDDGESVKLTFGTLPTGVTEGTTKETVVSITDDDVPAVTVSYEQGAYTVAEGSGSTVKVRLSEAPERQVVVIITKAEEDGASPGDYSGVPTSVTFESGDTEKTFTFTATADTVDDDGESVKLTFGTLPTGVTEGTTNETIVSITDDDVPAVTVSYEQGAYTVAESDDSSTTEVEEHKVTIKVKLSADPERTVTIPVNKVPQGGATSADYSGVPISVTFESGDTEKTFTFTVTADTVDDDGESVKLTFGTLPTGVTEGTTKETVVSITDDDVPAVTVSYEQGAYTVAEGSSTSVKVKLSADPERQVVVIITKAEEDGASPGDYSGVPTSVTFNSGDTEKTFDFTATQDTVDDDGESVKLTFGTLPTGVTEGTTNETVVSITDDDATTLPLISVQVSFGVYAYVVPEGGSVEVVINLSDDPERTVDILVNTTLQDGASTADFSGVPEFLTFNSGDSSKSFIFNATQDSVQDDGETVRLNFGILPDGVTPGSTTETSFSITEKVLVSFDMATNVATEGGPGATITVRLNAPAPRQVDISLTAEGHGGAIPTDWSGVPEMLTFNTSDTSKTFTLVAVDDDVEDNGEMVELGFSILPVGFAAGSPATARITLMNDDRAPSEPAQYGCPDDSGERMVLVGNGNISQAGESEFWRVEADPWRTYVIEVLGSEGKPDVMDVANPGGLTLSDPHLYGVWNGDGSELIRNTGQKRARLLRDRATDWSGFHQYEVQSFDGNTGTYQIRVRVNNICVTRDGNAMYSYAGGPDGYSSDLPANESTRIRLRPRPSSNISRSSFGFLGDNWDWYWDHAPDKDWFAVEGVSEDHEYTITVATRDDLAVKHQATRLKILAVYDNNGMVVPGTSGNGSGKSVSVTFEPDNTETFYVSVGSDPSDRTGVYWITVTGRKLQ